MRRNMDATACQVNARSGIEDEDENDEEDDVVVHGKPSFAFAHALGP